jgi:hypothetical protein
MSRARQRIQHQQHLQQEMRAIQIHAIATVAVAAEVVDVAVRNQKVAKVRMEIPAKIQQKVAKRVLPENQQMAQPIAVAAAVALQEMMSLQVKPSMKMA